MTKRKIKQLDDAISRVWTWCYNHAELCEEPDELRRLDRAFKSIDQVMDELKKEVPDGKRPSQGQA